MSEIITFSRAGSMFPLTVKIICVFVFINIDDCVGAEVDRVRTSGKTAVVFVRVKNLYCQGFPSSGRAPIKKTGPAFSDTAEFFLDKRD